MSPSPSRPRIRVFIVSSHLLAARYLLEILKTEKGITASRFDCSSRPAHAQSVSVFLIDCVGLPVAVEQCVSRLHFLDNRTRFVLVDEQTMQMERMVQLGIHGFLTHADTARKLIPAIQAVAEGKTWVGARSARDFLHQQLIRHNAGFTHRSRLTPRENAITELLKRRMSNNEIAALLGIRDSTVKFHVSNIFSKLQIKSRRDLLQKEHAFDLWNMLLHTSTSHNLKSEAA